MSISTNNIVGKVTPEQKLVGDVKIQTLDGSIKYFGDVGPRGKQGETGPQGPEGKQGKQGEVGPPGTTIYGELRDKPKINNIELEGNKTLEELGIQSKGNYIEDDNYVHTDNNFSNKEKEKLNSLNNYDDTEIKTSIENVNSLIGYINLELSTLTTVGGVE